MAPGLDFLLTAESATSTAPATGLSVIAPFADPAAALGAVFVLDAEALDFLSGDLTAVGFETSPPHGARHQLTIKKNSQRTEDCFSRGSGARVRLRGILKDEMRKTPIICFDPRRGGDFRTLSTADR